jgi:hypothetical protein
LDIRTASHLHTIFVYCQADGDHSEENVSVLLEVFSCDLLCTYSWHAFQGKGTSP